MRRVVFAAVAACALMGGPVAAEPPSNFKVTAYDRCLHEHRWCWKDVVDPITKHHDPMATLWSADKLFIRGHLYPVSMMITCGNGKTWAFIGVPDPLSYVGIKVDYRIEPAGLVGTALGVHMQEAKIFGMPETFPAELAKGDTMTARIADAADGSNAVVTFNIKGAQAEIDRLACAEDGK